MEDSPPARILLAVPSLSAGGAQRVVTEMANAWCGRGRRIAVVTLDSAANDFFELSAGIDRVPLEATAESTTFLSAILHNVDRIRRIQRVIRSWRPDVIISFVDQMNVLTLLAARRTRVPVVVAERTDPRHHVIGRAWCKLREMTYHRAAGVVVQTAAVARHLNSFVRADRVHVIPNGVRPFAAEHRERLPIVCGVGRLSVEKGFDRLIEAFALLSSDFPEWSLTIHGDGPQRALLEELAAPLRQVTLPGWSSSISSELARASIFVLPSRYEGFPNALLEAMAHGMAVASFDCESGPSEIIEHRVNGLLVPPNDLSELTKAIRQLMSDSVLRSTLGKQAARVSERFSMEQFHSRWEHLIVEVVREHKT